MAGDKRVTELTELIGIDPLDLIEVIDVSEPNINFKNKRIEVGELIGYFLPRNNYNADRLPIATDDSEIVVDGNNLYVSGGYSKGSQWMFDEVLYICFDSTPSAAKWKGVVDSGLIS